MVVVRGKTTAPRQNAVPAYYREASAPVWLKLVDLRQVTNEELGVLFLYPSRPVNLTGTIVDLRRPTPLSVSWWVGQGWLRRGRISTANGMGPRAAHSRRGVRTGGGIRAACMGGRRIYKATG